MGWNYRLCTKVVDYKRIFVILPVYYSAFGKAESYGEQWNQYVGETEDEVKDDLQRRNLSFARDVIDLDKFPEIWYG